MTASFPLSDTTPKCGWRSGLMVSALDSGASGPGSSPCCVLKQDTLLLQCLSLPTCINGYRQIVGVNLTNCGEVTCDGLASRPGEVQILLAASCYRIRDKLRQLWASLGSKASHLHLPYLQSMVLRLVYLDSRVNRKTLELHVIQWSGF